MISPTPSHRSPIKFRRSHHLGTIALVAVSVTLAGCSPAPSPTPTPTAAFASEEEAFAAAEETYRAYTDAINQVDFAEPSTFESVYSLLAGTTAASTRKIFSEFHAAKVRTIGLTRYDSFDGVSADLLGGIVSATVCVDVSGVDVLDESGASIVSADRPSRQPMLITFEPKAGRGALMLTTQNPTGEGACKP